MTARWLAALAMVVVLGGCGTATITAKSSLVAPIQLPRFDIDCAHGAAVKSHVVPLVVVRGARPTLGHSRALIVAAVCVNDTGPYDFLVDTGASTSAIDEGLARNLHLVNQTRLPTTNSFGCERHASVARLTSWSVGGTELAPQAIVVGTLRSPVIPTLGGLLGSDVLSSFGAVRIDYHDQVLTLGSGTRPNEDVAGSPAPPKLPSTLTTGTSHHVAMPVRVLTAPIPLAGSTVEMTVVSPTVEVAVGGHTYPFAVDTGAADTVVSPAVAANAHLTQLPQTLQTYAGLSCRVTVHLVQLRSWALGQVPLAAQEAGSNPIPRDAGLFGSGTLQNYNPVVVDYEEGELLFGESSKAG